MRRVDLPGRSLDSHSQKVMAHIGEACYLGGLRSSTVCLADLGLVDFGAVLIVLLLRTYDIPRNPGTIEMNDEPIR